VWRPTKKYSKLCVRFDVNVRGPVFLAQAALPHLRASSHAAVVNVLSADNQTIQVTYYSTNAQGQTNVTSATYERMQ